MSQTDTSVTQIQDSMLLESSKQGKQLIEKADSSMKADSLAEIDLKKEIESLKAYDKKKKESLQKQLDSIQEGIAKKNERIKKQVDSIRTNTQGIPVVFNHDTLLFIYSKLGPFSPSERARAIEGKLKKIAEDFSPEKLTTFNGEESTDLFYDQTVIMSITDRDAFWITNTTRSDLADRYKEILINSILTYLDDTSLMKTLLRVAMILLVLLIVFLMFKYLNRVFSKLVRYANSKGKKYLNGIRIKNYEILTYERELTFVTFLLNITKWFMILFIIYISLPIIFSIFPTTEGFAKKLIEYTLSPIYSSIRALIGYIPELISIAVIIIITRYFVKLVKFLSKEIEEEKLVVPGFYPDWAKPTASLLTFLIIAFSFVIIFPYLPGSDSPVFKGVSVFLGLLISLGSSSAIGNIIAGLVITYMRPFKIGDRVRIGETTGDVISKTMLVTKLRTIKNEDVTIPNAAILSGQTMNFSSSAKELGLILNTSITIGYDVHWSKVQNCLIEAALKTEMINKDPQPFVLQTSLDDFYVSYQLNAYTNNAEKAAKIYSSLHSNILDVFHDAGIEIMSPHFRAERDGSLIQTPEENHKK